LRRFGIALRLRALATLLLARERRRIASLKAQKMVTSSALQKRAALLTTTSSTGWSSVGEVLMIFSRRSTIAVNCAIAGEPSAK
jgi:hypothetical protein